MVALRVQVNRKSVVILLGKREAMSGRRLRVRAEAADAAWSLGWRLEAAG